MGLSNVSKQNRHICGPDAPFTAASCSGYGLSACSQKRTITLLGSSYDTFNAIKSILYFNLI